MCKNIRALALLVVLGLACSWTPGFLIAQDNPPDAQAEITDQPADQQAAQQPAEEAAPVLWRQPTNIGSRDLFYGPGGEADAPHTVFTFVEEDLHGTQPKFEVKDENGVKWKVKMGLEARPET